jgi:hypothetical protein
VDDIIVLVGAAASATAVMSSAVTGAIKKTIDAVCQAKKRCDCICFTTIPDIGSRGTGNAGPYKPTKGKTPNTDSQCKFACQNSGFDGGRCKE